VYETVLVSAKTRNQGVFLKGILPESETRMSALAKNIVQGDLGRFTRYSRDTAGSEADPPLPPIIVGNELADALGLRIGDNVQVISAETTTTPMGQDQRTGSFTLVAIFSSGLYDLDDGWVYVPLDRAQFLMGIGNDLVSHIDVKVRDQDLDRVAEIAESIKKQVTSQQLEYTTWIELNRSVFQALKLERLVMFLTIGLIVLVAALNIVGMLTMMVLEKTRDIAILLSMGATAKQIRKIFIWQGVIIGVVGTFFGLILGHLISFLADKYHLIHLAADVYTIAYVPFHANLLDSIIIAASAILISFIATLYPSAAAAKLQPVEALRYE
jgi:lipoprotein-releasing system permease protein